MPGWAIDLILWIFNLLCNGAAYHEKTQFKVGSCHHGFRFPPQIHSFIHLFIYFCVEFISTSFKLRDLFALLSAVPFFNLALPSVSEVSVLVWGVVEAKDTYLLLFLVITNPLP